MRAKRQLTRQTDAASAAKKSRQKSVQLKRASSSRDTSPPKSVRKVQDLHKKLNAKKLMPKSKKEIQTVESKTSNKEETKVSQTQTDSKSTLSTTDSFKSSKKNLKNSVEDISKKKETAKVCNAKAKSTAKKDSAKPVKKFDEKLPSAKDEKVSKELKNLGIQISDPSSSSDDKTIKASISEIVKTKSRTSASHSLYGKSAIGSDKSTASKSNENYGKDSVGKIDTSDITKVDDKKDSRNEVKEAKDVKPAKVMKKEMVKDSKKEKLNESEANNVAEKIPGSLFKTQNKKSPVEIKDSTTKNDAQLKAKAMEDKTENDFKKLVTQDISKDDKKVKKAKKTDEIEQNKKSKKVEKETSNDRPKKASNSAKSETPKKQKAAKSKKETENEESENNKKLSIPEGKEKNRKIEKIEDQLNKDLPNALSMSDCQSEHKKTSSSETERKSHSSNSKKIKSDVDLNIPATMKKDVDPTKLALKQSDVDQNTSALQKSDSVPNTSHLISVDLKAKSLKRKLTVPKKSVSTSNESTKSKDTKDLKQSSIASYVQTIEEVIAKSMCESMCETMCETICLDHTDVKSDQISRPPSDVKALKTPKTPKLKKPDNVPSDGSSPVKRKYVKKKDKIDSPNKSTITGKISEKSNQAKDVKEKTTKKTSPPKKKAKLKEEIVEKTEGEKLQLTSLTTSSQIINTANNGNTVTIVTPSEASNTVKERLEDTASKSKQFSDKLVASEDTPNNLITRIESSDSQIEPTQCTNLCETEPKQLNSKNEDTTPAYSTNNFNTVQSEEVTVSEQIENTSLHIDSPKFISEDSEDDDDLFINLPANLTSATFSGLNIDKPIKEAKQAGSSAPTFIPVVTNNEVDDSNETSTSSDDSIAEKRRKKKSTKTAKKKAMEKTAKKKLVNAKNVKTSKTTTKCQAKSQPEKPVPVTVKSKISVKSLESMKKPSIEDKPIKVEILTDDEYGNVVNEENFIFGPSTSSQYEPKVSQSTELATKRKYVRKKPLKSEPANANRGKEPVDDEKNDSFKKDVYDFHESGHSSEDTCLSYKKNTKNDNDTENKKTVIVDKSTKKPAAMSKKKLNKLDETDDDKINKNKNYQKSKMTKVSKTKLPLQKRKPSINHSDSSDSDDNKVLAKKFSKKKKILSTSISDTNSDAESNSEPSQSASKSKNQRKKLVDSYSGPKRHRMASLNALAKVQCLYENESRTAQELGFVKEPRNVPKEKLVLLLTSEDDSDNKVEIKPESPSPVKKDKETKKDKKVKQVQQLQREKDEKVNEVNDEEEAVVSRTLRTAPGLRGAGKLWEVSMSSMESTSDVDSDESYDDNKTDKIKAKKKPLPKRISTKQTQKSSLPKSKPKSSKTKTSSRRLLSSSNSDSSDHESELKPSSSKKQAKKKSKISPHDRKSDFKDLVVRKRMASLNASAMLAATYEVERHLDRCDSTYYGSSAESDTLVTPKKIKDIKREVEEPKETRPVSTNVVIVQDTDVTITGVYVNSSLGSSQEAYCKMQYRVQSSVTEERLVRPVTQDPPKSYTPLSALSCMLPPGSGDSTGVETQPPTIQHQPPYHHPQQHQIPLQHHLQNHHQSPDCETPSPFRYQSVYQQSPPAQMQSSSAFCAIPQPHPDGSGYYQPAGPLINSHLVPQSQTISTKAGSSGLDGDAVQLQSPATSGTENSDREVLITGGTPRPQTFHYPPQGHGPYQRPMHQMHCPTYPPANYYAPYGQHPQDMCYSPQYQPYYPPKVYPSSYRRYVTPSGYYPAAPNEMYDTQAPAQSQQPPSSQQIVPAGPQHIEHYPPYYSGYSPGSGPGGCYNRSMQPPYIDSSPYPSSCPCPMQSCPKNVHTGPLIGSKTSKGPVQSNHLVAPIDTATSITQSLNTTSVNQKITCKTEDLSPPPPVLIVKPETDTHLYHHSMSGKDITSSSSRDKAYDKIGHAPPNFTLNTKVLEPEMSISPARGSTGLPLPPIQAGATQPADNPIVARKARVGKSMAREMMMIPQQRHQVMNLQVDNSNVSHGRAIPQHTDIIIDVKHDPTLIKKEDMKTECDDDLVILGQSKFETPIKTVEDRTSTNYNGSRSSDDDIEICNKRKSCDSDVITLEDSVEETFPSIPIKKRKILELHKHPCKKSPPSSYKSLIKQSDPKPYLWKCDVPEKNVSRGRSRYRLIRGRGSTRYRQRKIIINGKPKKVLITNRKVKRRIIKKQVTKKVMPKPKVVQTDVKEVQVDEVEQLKSKDVAEENTVEKTEEKRLFMSSLELTIDGVAKGYFSDQEILAKSRLKNKMKCAEIRSKSETKKPPQIVESIESNVKMRDRSKSTTKPIIDSKPESKSTKGKSNGEKNNKNSKKFSKSSIARVVDETLLDDYSINNNNNIIFDNNCGKVQRSTATKKTKSRGAKFSNKKKHRVRQLQIEDIEIPRKSTAAPRWSNGWHWEGEPFKGKVFLNSDDAQVMRTRYPAMRHDSGDVIQPGDCVLLRAGSKKNELPYVAKVASLWENPEDGEMMMSLLWYYRPEHTEQLRQANDCIDEVFASKHQDHNSVACIEDKCYVLTFSEYCRYRRSLKAMEEGIVLPKPIAPYMYPSEEKVPINTNSELVLFCRRVYEFRLKRLIKHPKESTS